MPDGPAEAEPVPIDDLTPHPRNYRVHPDDQIEHLVAAIRQYGFVRNVVAAEDLTILAGHGAVEAARRAGLETVPVVRIPYGPDDPEALKFLALENELGRFAETDDRLLTELLRDVKDGAAGGLVGTGYDEMILANLIVVTRPRSEIPGFDAAAEWIGMPEYVPEDQVWKIVVQFRTEEDQTRFIEGHLRGVVQFTKLARKNRTTSAWWPRTDDVRHDGGLKWEQEPREPEEEPAQA